MTKPTLHEIAEMPFPNSQHEMRRHYVANWGKPEADGETQLWNVVLTYETREQNEWSIKVTAVDQDEAKDLAEDEFFKENFGDNEIIRSNAEVVSS